MAAIARGVDLPLQPGQRGHRGGRPSRQVRSVEPDAFIRGEETAIVLEDAEPVRADLGVGRVEVGGLDLAGRHRAIGQVMIEAADVALGEPVAIAEARPAVGPLHELVAEGQLQLGMVPQVAERPDAQPGRAGPRASRWRSVSLNPSGRLIPMPRSARAARRPASIADVLARQDLARDRAGVLGIEVQLVGLERMEEDLGAAQLAAVAGRGSWRRRAIRRADLAEDHRFGEGLGADADRLETNPGPSSTRAASKIQPVIGRPPRRRSSRGGAGR